MNFLRMKYWSPYLAGILIGLLQIPIFIFLNASLGTSGSYNSIACTILSLLSYSPNLSVNCFPVLKSWWQIGFVVGIVFGAYLSARLSNSIKYNISPVWNKLLGIRSLGKRMIMGFLGGFIMLLGARLADGCTSGNGISGIALLSVGSMIVILSMFLGGILVSFFYKKV